MVSRRATYLKRMWRHLEKLGQHQLRRYLGGSQTYVMSSDFSQAKRYYRNIRCLTGACTVLQHGRQFVTLVSPLGDSSDPQIQPVLVFPQADSLEIRAAGAVSVCEFPALLALLEAKLPLDGAAVFEQVIMASAGVSQYDPLLLEYAI